jgi:hypothetical protein
MLQYDLKKRLKSNAFHVFPFSFEQIILQLSKFISGTKGESSVRWLLKWSLETKLLGVDSS